MYTVVLQTCKSHEQIWENIPAFANAVANLTAKLDEFTTTAEKRLMDTPRCREITFGATSWCISWSWV